MKIIKIFNYFRLTFPGTESKVLSGRFQDDDSMKGFNNWRFMSIHFWGEDPTGSWKLHVHNNDNDRVRSYISAIKHSI